MPTMVDECWKQRVDLETRGKNFSRYWANQHPHLFAKSSLEQIERDEIENTNDKFRTTSRQHFASQRYPNKYMRLKGNDNQYSAFVPPSTSTTLVGRNTPQRTGTPAWSPNYPTSQSQPPLMPYSVPMATYPNQMTGATSAQFRRFSSSWSSQNLAQHRPPLVLGAGGAGLSRTTHGHFVAREPPAIAGMWGYHSQRRDMLMPIRHSVAPRDFNPERRW